MTEIEIFFKLTNPDGTSFHYPNAKYIVGKTIKKPKKEDPKICTSDVIHASRDVMDAIESLIKIPIPFTIHKVSGIPVTEKPGKCGFFSLKVIKTLPQSQYDQLAGFKYNEACNPINPMDIQNEVSDQDKENLRKWASVWASVRASVWASVRDSVWASVRDSVWDSVWASVWDSGWDSVWDSVRDSVWAYIGSLFPNMKKWKYIDHKEGEYPFQPAVDLWKRGFVPVKIGNTWHLYGWRDRKAVSLYQEAKA